VTTNPVLLVAFVIAATSIATWAVVNGLFWLTRRYHGDPAEKPSGPMP
jgi:hypothetical protein